MGKGPSIDGRQKREKPSEKKLAAIRENGLAPKVYLPPSDEARERTREMKRRLLGALTREGVEFIEQIIQAGPFANAITYDSEGNAEPIALYEEKSRLWQYAMNFAADRGGLPRVAAVDVEVDAIPGIRVELPDFPKPSDV